MLASVYITYVNHVMYDRRFIKIVFSCCLILSLWTAVLAFPFSALEITSSKARPDEARHFDNNRNYFSVKRYISKIDTRDFIVRTCHHLDDISNVDDAKNREQFEVRFNCIETFPGMNQRFMVNYNARNSIHPHPFIMA